MRNTKHSFHIRNSIKNPLWIIWHVSQKVGPMNWQSQRHCTFTSTSTKMICMLCFPSILNMRYATFQIFHSRFSFSCLLSVFIYAFVSLPRSIPSTCDYLILRSRNRGVLIVLIYAFADVLLSKKNRLSADYGRISYDTSTRSKTRTNGKSHSAFFGIWIWAFGCKSSPKIGLLTNAMFATRCGTCESKSEFCVGWHTFQWFFIQTYWYHSNGFYSTPQISLSLSLSECLLKKAAKYVCVLVK